MNTALIIGIIILGGVSLMFILHYRSVRNMKPILIRLAAEKNGTVESPSLFLMPKLRFDHSDSVLEVCRADFRLYQLLKGIGLIHILCRN
jgi:hypothetical protein